jgi:hypothetical protein
MSTLKPAELRIVERILGMGQGYVLDFSNRTFAEFFDNEMGVDIDDQRWNGNGTSKANRLRAYLKLTDDAKVGKLLRALDDYRTTTSFQTLNADSELQAKFLEIVGRLTSTTDPTKAEIDTKALDLFEQDESLGELISAIQAEAKADKPHVALDRLHTYCMKRFAHLIETYKAGVAPLDTLTGRVGQYMNELKESSKIDNPISFSIFRHASFVFDKLNELRNKNSFAHDNDLIRKSEARFIFESVCNILRFIKSTEGHKFDG